MIAAAIPSPSSSLLPYFGPKLAGQVLPRLTLPLQTQLPPPGDDGLASGPYWNRVMMGADCMGCMSPIGATVEAGNVNDLIPLFRPVTLIGAELGEGAGVGSALALIGGVVVLTAVVAAGVALAGRGLHDPHLAPLPRRRHRKRGH